MSQNKGKYTYIWVSFILLIFGIYVVPKVLNRISEKGITDNSRLHKNSIDKLSDGLKVVAKVPSFQLIDENNHQFSNDSFKGKVYLVEFFFSTCPSICPIMNKNIRILDDLYNERSDFGVISVSIDANDTPSVLKNHAKELGVKSKNWRFLTGQQTKVFDIAKQFNLFAAANADVPGGFEHSGLFALIDKKGNIRCRLGEFDQPIIYYDGIEKPGIEMLKEDIQILLNEK